jgi:hypothetical protein
MPAQPELSPTTPTRTAAVQAPPRSYARYPIPPVRPSSSRPLPQRITLRFPRFARVVRSAVLRLPPRSRLRQRLIAQSVRDGIEAFNRRDWKAALMTHDREVDLHLVWPGEGALSLDLGEHHRGYEGYVRFYTAWLQVWDEFEVHTEEIIDFGDKMVMLLSYVGHAKASGMDLHQPTAIISTFRNGSVVREDTYMERSQGLEAVALSE